MSAAGETVSDRAKSDRAKSDRAGSDRAASGRFDPGDRGRIDREGTAASGADPRAVDRAPGDQDGSDAEIASGVRGYLVGLGLATLLTVISFTIGGTGLVWAPGVPVALVVFAIAQMGVHLVFFLHITTGPDNTNNVLALAFGTLIVLLVIGGSLWIMANLSDNMLPMSEIMKMQR